jgi:hypothetical protein
MFGWSGYQMAQLYTKKADRKRLAARALAKWTRPSSDDAIEPGTIAHLHLEKEHAWNIGRYHWWEVVMHGSKSFEINASNRIGGPGRTRTCNQTVMSGRL